MDLKPYSTQASHPYQPPSLPSLHLSLFPILVKFFSIYSVFTKSLYQFILIIINLKKNLCLLFLGLLFKTHVLIVKLKFNHKIFKPVQYFRSATYYLLFTTLSLLPSIPPTPFFFVTRLHNHKQTID